jgi:hypothetical protein
MDRFLRRVVALAAMGVVVASIASANVPQPGLSNVPQCLGISPNGALAYRATIIGQGGPIVGSSVEVRFNIPGDTLVCWCATVPGPRPRSFFATANGVGVATFNITAGGCIEYLLPAIPGPQDLAGEIFADNTKMEEFGTVSPDAVDGGGLLPTNTSPLWNPAGSCATGLADAVQHTGPLSTSAYEWCTDMNCDNVVGLSDASILTPFLAGAATCAGDAGP